MGSTDPEGGEGPEAPDFLATQAVFGVGSRPAVGLDVLATKVAVDFQGDIYHAIGVVGPQTAYHRVFLNGKPQGIYLQIEWIDGKMFDRHGLGSDGELYHPQDSHFCGDLDKKGKYDI